MEMLVLPLSEKPFLLAEAGLGTLIGSNKTYKLPIGSS